MRRFILFLLSMSLFGLVAACGGGGGGGGGSEQADSTSAPNGSAASDVRTAAAEFSSAVLPDNGLPYQITLLGALGRDNWAVAINDAGQVTGNYEEADGTVSVFFWDSGRMVPLVVAAQAADLNEFGEVVGWFEGANSAAFLYDGSAIRLAPDAAFSRAYSINDAGQVVGRRKNPGEEAFLDDRGRLQPIAAEIDGYAARINNRGQIALQEFRSGVVAALLWDGGALTDLGTLGGSDLYVRDLNDAGQAVGWGTTAAGEYHAFLWRDGRLTDLAPEIREIFCSAVAISEDGTVLIKADGIQGSNSYLWRDGEVTHLGKFGAAAAVVTDMNNHGQIVGWLETGEGELRAFLATPKAMLD